MPNTLIPIQTYTLTGTASSITFAGIPQNYTDLRLELSARTSRTAVGDWMTVAFNGSTSNFTSRYIESTSSAAYSNSDTNVIGDIAAASSTSGIFSSTTVDIFNYTASTNKLYRAKSAAANNGTPAYMTAYSGMWANSSAISSITLASGSSSIFSIGSTFTLYGVSNGVKATGGTLTVAGGYAYHTFTSTSTFLPNQQIKNAELLVVAGGGGAASGGGGAGGLIYAPAQTLNAGNVYTAIIGAGGTAGYTDVGGGSGATSGFNSSFSSFNAIGGGKGGQAGGTQGTQPGGNGGSGGGGAANGGGTSTGGTGTTGQGNNGGTNSGYTVDPYPSGGGGGAAAAGQNAVSATVSGSGGDGTSAYEAWHLVTNTGVSVSGKYYIAGGGGGGGYFSNGTRGAGGFGGGGNGGQQGSAVAGTANSGGGGGGGSNGLAGAAGGSGIIIVRYPLA